LTQTNYSKSKNNNVRTNNVSKFLLIVLTTLLLIFLFLTIKFFAINLKILTENNKYTWVKTEAIIEDIKLLETPNPYYIDDKILYETFSNKTCQIKYKYIYKNNEYFNSNIGIQKTSLPKTDLDYSNANQFHNALFEKLKNEKKVFVYVNPNKPENSSIIKYYFEYRKIGSVIMTLTFSICIGLFLFINFKYQSDHISNQIKTIK